MKKVILFFLVILFVTLVWGYSQGQTTVEQLPVVKIGQTETAPTALADGVYEAVAQPLVAHVGSDNEGKDLTNIGQAVDVTISVTSGIMTFPTNQLQPGKYLVRIAPDISMKLVRSITDPEERKKFGDMVINETKHFNIEILPQ